MLPDDEFCRPVTAEPLPATPPAGDDADEAWFSLLASRLSLSEAMPPVEGTAALLVDAEVAVGATDEPTRWLWLMLATVLALDAAEDAVRALVDMDAGPPLEPRLVAFAGSVSLLKNISRLLCNCNTKRRRH